MTATSTSSATSSLATVAQISDIKRLPTFKSPSGNIFCALEYVGQVSCVISQMNSVPPNPKKLTCGGGAQWGHSVLVTQKVQGAQALDVFCGWTPDNFTYSVKSVPVLPYGQTDVTAAGVCVSEQSGITCRLRVGDQMGWGFTINKSGITLIKNVDPTPDEWKLP